MRQSGPNPAGARRLDELQHEAVLLAAMLHDEPRAIVLGIAQHAGSRLQFEARLLYLLYFKGLVDPMQGVGVALARAGLRAVVDDSVNAPGLECLNHRRVDLVAVVPAPDHVVVVYVDDPRVERFGWDRQD